MWTRIVEKSFSKNFVKKNMFAALFPNTHNQEPKPWWREKTKCLQKNRLKNMLRKKHCLKRRRLERCYNNGWRWIQMNSNGSDKLVWKTCSTCSGLHHEKTCYEFFYKLGKKQKMEESKDNCVVKKFWLIRYSPWTTWDF